HNHRGIERAEALDQFAAPARELRCYIFVRHGQGNSRTWPSISCLHPNYRTRAWANRIRINRQLMASASVKGSSATCENQLIKVFQKPPMSTKAGCFLQGADEMSESRIFFSTNFSKARCSMGAVTILLIFFVLTASSLS